MKAKTVDDFIAFVKRNEDLLNRWQEAENVKKLRKIRKKAFDFFDELTADNYIPLRHEIIKTKREILIMMFDYMRTTQGFLSFDNFLNFMDRILNRMFEEYKLRKQEMGMEKVLEKEKSEIVKRIDEINKTNEILKKEVKEIEKRIDKNG